MLYSGSNLKSDTCEQQWEPLKTSEAEKTTVRNMGMSGRVQVWVVKMF